MNCTKIIATFQMYNYKPKRSSKKLTNNGLDQSLDEESFRIEPENQTMDIISINVSYCNFKYK